VRLLNAPRTRQMFLDLSMAGRGRGLPAGRRGALFENQCSGGPEGAEGEDYDNDPVVTVRSRGQGGRGSGRGVMSEGAEDEGYGDDPAVRNRAQGGRGRGRGVTSEGAEDEDYCNDPTVRNHA
jgi:hypothetical protein